MLNFRRIRKSKKKPKKGYSIHSSLTASSTPPSCEFISELSRSSPALQTDSIIVEKETSISSPSTPDPELKVQPSPYGLSLSLVHSTYDALVSPKKSGSKSARELRKYTFESSIDGFDHVMKAYKGTNEMLKFVVKKARMDVPGIVDAMHEGNIQRLLSNSELRAQSGFPYIVAFVDSLIVPRRNMQYLIMEYCEGGALFDLIDHYGFRIEVAVLNQLALDITKGLAYMQRLHVAHRDLKLENIYLKYSIEEKRYVAKIGDFGSSIQVDDDTLSYSEIHTLNYCAPEIFTRTPRHPFYSDAWSLGVCYYVMLEHRYPFDTNRDLPPIERATIAQASVCADPKKIFLDLMKDDIHFSSMLVKLFTIDHLQRPLAHECLLDPYFLQAPLASLSLKKFHELAQ